jgi:hypothetical protein
MEYRMIRALLIVCIAAAVPATAAVLPTTYSLTADGASPLLAPGDPPDTMLAGNVIAEMREMVDVGQHTIWVGTTSGVSRNAGPAISLENWLTYTEYHGLGGNSTSGIETEDNLIAVASAGDTTIGTLNTDYGKGLAWSDDYGSFWTFTPQSVDEPGDSILIYPPADTIPCIPITTVVQNASYHVFIEEDRIWTCNWAGGLRYTDDFGQTWNRVILPPDDTDTLRADGTHNWEFSLDPRDPYMGGNHGHTVFSVHVLEDTVWVGTAKGIVVSTDGGVEWYRTWRLQNLLSDFVVDIDRQETSDGRVLYWAACGLAGSREGGISWTEDWGASWNTYLDSVFISNVEVQGDTVWATASIYSPTGLYRSTNFGQTWDHFTVDDGLPSSEVNTALVSLVDGVRTVWAGTNDGLAYTQDDGATWDQLISSPPIAPGYDTYAFPSPFSPSREELGVRIRYRLPSDGTVTITVYDFNLEKVATPVSGQLRSGGEELTDFWDGHNSSGDRAANGIYFYQIEGGGTTMWGKVAVLD